MPTQRLAERLAERVNPRINVRGDYASKECILEQKWYRHRFAVDCNQNSSHKQVKRRTEVTEGGATLAMAKDTCVACGCSSVTTWGSRTRRGLTVGVESDSGGGGGGGERGAAGAGDSTAMTEVLVTTGAASGSP